MKQFLSLALVVLALAPARSEVLPRESFYLLQPAPPPTRPQPRPRPSQAEREQLARLKAEVDWYADRNFSPAYVSYRIALRAYRRALAEYQRKGY